MSTSKKQKVTVIVGQTATGKSALAVRLAKKFNGEVISADSRQVYRGLDVGTGKITKREMQGIPHHLIDIASPRRQYSAALFVRDATNVIRYIVRNGKVPIVCGGTGFYIDALLGGIQIPHVPPNHKLRKQLAHKTPAELLALLKKLDPRRAKTIEQKNPRRLIRAIEIAKALGRVPLPSRSPSLYTPLFIGLQLPDEALRKRIAKRVTEWLRTGLIAEGKHLHRQGLSYKRMESIGLEYRALSQYLQGKLTKKELEIRLERVTWDYARRQKTWFKRNKKIKWFKPAQYKKIEQEVKIFLS